MADSTKERHRLAAASWSRPARAWPPPRPSARWRRSASAQQVPEPPGRKLGWAIVGLGSLADQPDPARLRKCEKSRVVALVSGHPEKARKLAARYGVDPKRTSTTTRITTRIKDNPEVDVIYVVLPNSMHAEYTIRAHQAGKHVLCEKPMANTPADCQEMIDAAKQGGPQADGRLPLPLRALQPGDDPDGARAGARAGQGDPGRPRLQHRRPDPVAAQERPRGRRLADGHRHLQPAGRALHHRRRADRDQRHDATPRRETCASRKSKRRSTSSSASRAARSPTARRATATRARTATGWSRTKGWFELEPATSYTGLRMRVRRGNVTEERDLPQRDHFALEMDHLSECVMENKEPLTPGEEGLRDLKLMMAIYASSRGRLSCGRATVAASDRPDSGHGRLRVRPGLERERVFRAEGVEVPVARLRHIVESKAAVGRPKDRPVSRHPRRGAARAAARRVGPGDQARARVSRSSAFAIAA